MADQDYLTVPHLDRRVLRRLFSTIQVDPQTECWLWTGRENGHGYGRTYLNHRQESIHRVIYAWLVQPLPRGLGRDIPQLDHIVCSRRNCANPAHMILTTARENNLRSTSACAEHARQTHCINGHLLDGWNLMPRNDGGRACKVCHYNKQRERKRKLRRAKGIKERRPYRIKLREHKGF